jgi:hypothetical protein
MPWKPEDANQHVQGLTAHQRVVWSRVANNALRSCLSDGGAQSECESRAVRQANAAAQRAPEKSVKAAGDGALEILAVPFGGPMAGRDTDGEFFSARTELCLDWFPSARPLLYHHGLEDTLQASPVGTVDVKSAKQTDAGWWVRAQLDTSHQYWKDIAALIEDDALFASSAAVPWLVKRADDGEILRWPWIELSLTPSPANFYAVVSKAEVSKHFKAAGLPVPDLRDDEIEAKRRRLSRHQLEAVIATLQALMGDDEEDGGDEPPAADEGKSADPPALTDLLAQLGADLETASARVHELPDDEAFAVKDDLSSLARRLALARSELDTTLKRASATGELSPRELARQFANLEAVYGPVAAASGPSWRNG